MPALRLESIIPPTEPITKMGPEVELNKAHLVSSLSEIFPWL